MIDDRILRERIANLGAGLDNLTAADASTTSSMVVQTASQGSYPTVAVRYYAGIPQGVVGTEAENQTPTFASGSGVVYFANLGATVIPSGTKVKIDLVGGRWVTRYD